MKLNFICSFLRSFKKKHLLKIATYKLLAIDNLSVYLAWLQKDDMFKTTLFLNWEIMHYFSIVDSTVLIKALTVKEFKIFVIF